MHYIEHYTSCMLCAERSAQATPPAICGKISFCKLWYGRDYSGAGCMVVTTRMDRIAVKMWKNPNFFRNVRENFENCCIAFASGVPKCELMRWMRMGTQCLTPEELNFTWRSPRLCRLVSRHAPNWIERCNSRWGALPDWTDYSKGRNHNDVERCGLAVLARRQSQIIRGLPSTPSTMPKRTAEGPHPEDPNPGMFAAAAGLQTVGLPVPAAAPSPVLASALRPVQDPPVTICVCEPMDIEPAPFSIDWMEVDWDGSFGDPMEVEWPSLWGAPRGDLARWSDQDHHQGAMNKQDASYCSRARWEDSRRARHQGTRGVRTSGVAPGKLGPSEEAWSRRDGLDLCGTLFAVELRAGVRVAPGGGGE